MELKKSYKGFVLWMIGFLAAIFAVAFIPAQDEMMPMRLIMLVTVWAVAGMAFIIWRTERVYWYSGLTYEDALEAGSERRKAFALRHLKVFGAFSTGIVACTALMHLLGAPVWIDIAAATAGLCGAAVWTMPIEL